MVKAWQKYIDKLVNKEKLIFRDVIQKIILKDFEGLDIVPLFGIENYYRCRIGDKRTIFSVESSRVIIRKIGPRGDVYK